MYQTNQAFLEAMDDISRTLAVQVEIGGDVYPTESIIDFELERGAFDGDVFTIGQTLSSALTLTIFTTSSVKLGDEVKLFTDLLVGDSYVRVPMGVYYVDSTSVNQEKMTLTCYDKMVSLVEEYIPSGDHKTLAALFNDVRTQIGMKYDGAFTDVAIKQPLYGYTYRETLGFIASLNGGNMIINRSGNLEIQGYQEVERHIPAKTCFSFDVKEGYHVSKVFCLFGDVGVSRGDNTGQCVSFENPYVTEQNIDVIYNRLKGLRFTAGSLKYRGDLTLDPGDLFTFTDYKGDEYRLMCGRNKLTFNGGLSGQLESIGESENSNVYAEHQLKYKKNMTKVTAELGKIQALVQEIEQSHDGLEERVKKAELEMTADAITSKIKDSFVSKDDMGNLVTQEELTSAISQTTNDITLQVSSNYETKENVTTKIDNIQIGGTNLVINSDFFAGKRTNWTYSSAWTIHTTEKYKDKYIIYSSRTGLTSDSWAELRSNKIEAKEGETFTMSVDIKWQDVPSTEGFPIAIWGYDDNGANRQTIKSKTVDGSQDWHRFVLTGAVPAGVTHVRACISQKRNGSIYATNFKLEKGNKVTDWSPAPEDVASDIATAKTDAINSANSTLTETIKDYYTKTQTDSAINVAKDAINLSVSNTYETKESVTTKVNSAVSTAASDAQTKANTALSSAKTYADTKKTEAINSANNTTTEKLKSYSTTTQMNSAISVAKNEINSSVSSTYETKTEVANKINNIQIGGRNLYTNTKMVNKSQWGNNNVWDTTETHNGFTVFKRTGAWNGLYRSDVEFELNETYTLSVWGKGENGATGLCFYSDANISILNRNFTQDAIISDDWVRYFVTFKVIKTDIALRVRFENPKSGATLRLCGFKLEKGNKVTDWTPAPEDVETSVTNLQTRMNTAEQKITDAAITSTVKQNFYTKEETNNQITSKGYQTASQVQQTVDALQVKFTESGGYNRILNGCFKKGTKSWVVFGTPTVSVITDTSCGYDYSLKIITSTTNQGCQQKVDNLVIGKPYTFSSYAYGKSGACGIQVNNGGTYSSALLTKSDTWERLSVSFVASATTVTLQLGRGAWGSNGTHYFVAAQLEDGEMVSPYIPHSSEIYDGITTIDRDGVEVEGTNVNTKTQMTADGFKIIRKSDNKELFNASNGNLTMEGTLRTSSNGLRVEVSGTDYKIYDGNTMKGFFGFNEFGAAKYNAPRIYLAVDGVTGTNSHFSLTHYSPVSNPLNTGISYADFAYYSADLQDYSNIYMSGNSGIKIAPLLGLDIDTHCKLGQYTGKTTTNLAKFLSTKPTENKGWYDGTLRIESISNTTNPYGLILADNRTNGFAAVSVYADSNGGKHFSPCGNNNTSCGDATYKWNIVYSNNGTIQTCDERFKVKRGYSDVEDCYNMVKNVPLYNYVMLEQSKEELSKNRLGKLAMINASDDTKVHMGIMAQDLQQYDCGRHILVGDTCEKTDSTTDTTLHINPLDMTMALMGALKVEIEKRETLEKRLALLENKLNQLETLLA